MENGRNGKSLLNFCVGYNRYVDKLAIAMCRVDLEKEPFSACI